MAAMTEPSPRWERSPYVLWRRSGRRIVLKLPDRDELVILDRSGVELWDELTGPVTVLQVAEVLGVRFGVDPELVAADIVPVLADLEARDLVHRWPA